MQRPIWYRVLIAVWGLWFVTALSDVGGVHSCPMHGNHAAHGGHAVARSSAHTGGTHRTQSAANEHHGAPSSPTDHSKTTCTCFGSCCGATAINVPAQPAALPVEVIVDVDVVLHHDATATGLRRAYAHPFANGPPASAAL